MTHIEIIAQILAIVVAFSMGRHDGPAIKVYHEKGWLGKKDNWWFHQTNNLTKFLILLLLSITAAPEIRSMVFIACTSFLWIYLVFDMTTGKWGHAKSYWYLGFNDWNGKLWRRVFKTHPGQWKATILLITVLALNGWKILFL